LCGFNFLWSSLACTLWSNQEEEEDICRSGCHRGLSWVTRETYYLLPDCSRRVYVLWNMFVSFHQLLCLIFFLQIMMALTVHSREPRSKRRRSQWVFDIFCLPKFFFPFIKLGFWDYVPHILFILMVVRLNEDHWIKKMSMLLKIWRVLYISFSDNSSDINLNLTEGILQSILMMRKRWRELICTSNVTRGREVTWITYTTR